MKKNILKTLGLFAITATALVVGDVAMAQDLNAVTTQVKGQLPGVADLISAVAYVAGIGFALKAGFKLKEHNESKGQIPLSQPITLAIVAALCLGLPTLLSNAKGTIFSAGANGTSLAGQEARNIR